MTKGRFERQRSNGVQNKELITGYGHKKSILGAQFFQRHLTARWCVVPFLKKMYGCPYFLKTCRAPTLSTMPFFLSDPQHFVISSGYRVV